MNFSADRDLLVLEPGVFVYVPFASQQRVEVNDGELTGTTLKSAEADFEAAQVEPGGVVLIERVGYEVIAVEDEQTLTVSRPRRRLSEASIAGADGEELEVRVRTFQPQAALVHDALLRLLGLRPEEDGDEAMLPAGRALTEESVVSLSTMARLEALGTLERVYSAALAVSGENAGLEAKARLYREQFRQACRGASVLIDVDGDGHADERRHLGLVRMVRA